MFRNCTPESGVSSSSSTVCSRDSVDLAPVVKRDGFSEKTMFWDALDMQDAELRRLDTFNSVFVDAAEENEEEEEEAEKGVEVKETMEVAVVAEVQDGMLIRDDG